MDAAVREIAQDREAFAEARIEALTRIGKLLCSVMILRRF